MTSQLKKLRPEDNEMTSSKWWEKITANPGHITIDYGVTEK